jgi:hypothetical protein
MFDSKTVAPFTFAPFAAAWEGQIARVEAFWAQVAEMETKAMAQAKSNVDEQARLTRETITYAGNLATEFRKASLEMVKRTAQMMTTPIA